MFIVSNSFFNVLKNIDPSCSSQNVIIDATIT